MSSKACKVCNLNESIPQRGETGNIITTVPCLITYFNVLQRLAKRPCNGVYVHLNKRYNQNK
jgi:hypothetical protein